MPGWRVGSRGSHAQTRLPKSVASANCVGRPSGSVGVPIGRIDGSLARQIVSATQPATSCPAGWPGANGAAA